MIYLQNFIRISGLQFVLFLLFVSNISFADDIQMLKSIDTKSPRDTLQSFLSSVHKAHEAHVAIQQSYIRSSRLFLSDEEEKKQVLIQYQIEFAKRTLNLSKIPEAILQKTALDKVLELVEVLGRIELPEMESIPDLKAMDAFEFKRWTIPGTDIVIKRVETGSRAGEYLFSPHTVSELSSYYQRIKHLPYKLNAITGVYESFRYGTGGLRGIIPLRWLLALPDWLTFTILDQPIWRWIGVLIVLLFTILITNFIHRLVSIWAMKSNNAELHKRWIIIARPASLIVLIPVVLNILEVNLRISQEVFTFFTFTLTALLTISATWVIWASGNLLAEIIVHSKNLVTGSIDSQLIRLSFRFISFILAVTVLVFGSQYLGIPAYSIITGLGVGGVAVAFAAKDSVANLLGSIVIMFEKPFRVGHWIKSGNTEGIVESIGFRSTRIRTFYNSVVSIPSDKLVNIVVDNMGMRNKRRIRTTFYIKYNTDAAKVEAFVTEIKNIVSKCKLASTDNTQIAFKGFATYGLEILVSFFLEVDNISTELSERQNIMMDILRLAESMRIEFSVPVNFNEPT